MDQRRLPLVGLAAASVIALFGCANAETELAQGPAAVATYEYNHGDGIDTYDRIAASFLMSDDAAYITRQVLGVNGGIV